MSSEILLTDRTSAETDDTCGMRFWFYKHAGGKGIIPLQEVIHFAVGREIHEDLATIASMSDLSPDAVRAQVQALVPGDFDDLSQAEKERITRRLGWFAAYALYIEPVVRAQYVDVAVESELILDRSPLWVAITPDRILRHKRDGYLVYREYKSTISASNKWLNSWKYAIQLHTSMAAVAEELGEPVRYAQVMGLMKGQERAGRLAHPYVWAYHNATTGEWTEDYSRARGAAWAPMPVWEYPGGVVSWVERLGPEVAAEQFPHTEPIFPDADILADWIVRRTKREQDIRASLEAAQADPLVRATVFPKITKQCVPAFGDSCAYLGVCRNATWREHPEAHPDYVERIPHHQIELEWREGRL